jgi:periplasmic divalent cation tolerance protein
MTELLLVMTSLPDEDAAKALAKDLIDAHLAACVQIQSEAVLVAKTTAEQWPAISAFIKQNHPYDVPEIIAQPITHSHTDYARWVIAETTVTPN